MASRQEYSGCRRALSQFCHWIIGLVIPAAIDPTHELSKLALMMIPRLTIIAALAGSTIGLAACSNTASQMLTTGSLFNSKPQPGATASQPVAPPATPEDRAILVAATSARATKCGYYFDPSKLRTDFLASEAQVGLAPDQLAKITKVYDYTNGKVTSLIAANEGYCTDDRVKSIKASLTRHLAGDFTAPKKRKVADGGGVFDWMSEEPIEKQKWNPNAVHDPILEPGTKRTQE